MESACRVFIVEHDRDSLEMLTILVEEELKCTVGGGLETGDTFEHIRAFGPDVVILDFTPHHTHDPDLLDRLRTEEATSSTPVIAMSTIEPVVEHTQASFNVRRILVKPFDLGVLSNTLQDILRGPKFELRDTTAGPGARQFREAAVILTDSAREVITQWLQRVSEIEPFKSELRLRPTQQLDEMPALLWATVVGLRTGQPEDLFRERAFFREAAVRHAVERRRQGVALATLIREYKLLRDAIWQTLRDNAPREAWTVEDVFRVGEVVHRTLDEVSVITVGTYSDLQAKVTQ